MSDLTIPKGDYGYNLSFTIQDDDGNAYNLLGYTITIKVWPQHMPGEPIVSDTCIIDVAASGTCHYPIKVGDFANAADYLIELELTKVGIIESTRNYTLTVEESP